MTMKVTKEFTLDDRAEIDRRLDNGESIVALRCSFPYSRKLLSEYANFRAYKQGYESHHDKVSKVRQSKKFYFSMHIPEGLRRRRWTVDVFAEALDIDVMQARNYIAGRLMPEAKRLCEIINALSIDIEAHRPPMPKKYL